MNLWRFKVVGGLHAQRLRENAYLAPTLRRETKFYLTVGWGPCPKFLEAYMDEVALPTDST